MGIAAMLVWAVVLLSFYVSGRVESYIRPEYLRTCTLLAGLGLLALSLFNLRHFRSSVSCGHDHHHDQDHGGCDHHHDHDHAHCDHDHGLDVHDHEDTSISGNGALLAIMVVPVLVSVFYSQDRFLSAATIRNKGFVQDTNAVAARVEKEINAAAPGTVSKSGEDGILEYTLADLEKVVQRSPEGNLMLTVDQLFYTAGDAELQRVLKGQAVEAVGQVIPDPDSGRKNRLRLFILMVSCCAADAQPVSIAVEFPGKPPEHKEMQWVKVSGTMVYNVENGQKQAVLKAAKMEPTKEPANDLLY